MGILNKRSLVGYWRADNHDVANDRLTDLSGNDNHAQLGSTSGSDTNDPTILKYEGEQYVFLPGGTSNRLSATHADVGALTGNKTFTFDIALDDWTPATEHVLFDKLSGNDGIQLVIQTDGKVELNVGDGASVDALTSTAATGLTDGTRHTIVAVWVDASQVSFTVDGSALGSAVASSQTLTDTAGAILVGNNFTGKLYSASVTDSASTTHLSPDLTTASTPFATFTDTQSNVWTINRSATGLKSSVVDRTLALLGTDDFFEVADSDDLDFALGDSFTVVYAGRTYKNDPGGAVHETFIGKKDGLGSQAGYVLMSVTGVDDWRVQISDGSASVTDVVTTITEGAATVFGAVCNVPDDDVEAFTDGVGTGSPATNTLTATLANAKPLLIGAATVTTHYNNAEFFAAAVFREALSDAEMVAVVDDILTGTSVGGTGRRRRRQIERELLGV